MARIQAAKIDELKARFRGEILLPGDHGYDSARKMWSLL